jgi:Divergent InlB B-repeat domain/FG-GAP repeat
LDIFTRSSGVWSQQDKLVAMDAAGPRVFQGISVALSSDGNTAIVGGLQDNYDTGAAWVFTRSSGVWSQQGGKLVGTGAVGPANQGSSVALSGDGNTALVGGPYDNYGGTIPPGTSLIGAAWVFTRSGGVWTQQGNKLVGTGAVGPNVTQGNSVALSSDGNTAVVGGYNDNGGSPEQGVFAYGIGAAWVFTRSGGVWTQQGNKLVGTGAVGQSAQGRSVSLSSDGNTAIVGGFVDNSGIGAAWVFTRSGGVWTQQGNKLVGTGAIGNALQGVSVALSGDGITAIVGGIFDNGYLGAAWVFVQPVLQVAPTTNIVASGTQGGTFSPTSFRYTVSATYSSVKYSIITPSWLTASPESGIVTTSAKTITFTVNANAQGLQPDTYINSISFYNTTNNQGNTTRLATLTVNPRQFKISVRASPSADGTVSGSGIFAEGTSQTVTATPNNGRTFVHWTENARVVSTSESYTFTVNSNVTLVADFQ